MEQDLPDVVLGRPADNGSGALVEDIELEQHQRLLSSHRTHDTQKMGYTTQNPRLTDWYKPFKTQYTGWRAGVHYCSIAALSVLIVNLIVLIWAVTNHEMESAYSILYSGSCHTARSLSTALRLLINILSTALLSASSYTMQCVNAPTREDIDKAHSQKKWVDIGIPSWRNRLFVGSRNVKIWWFLGISSIPLHFLLPRHFCAAIQRFYKHQWAQYQMKNLPAIQFRKINFRDCKQLYSSPYITGSGDAYLVVPDIYYRLRLDNSTGEILTNVTASASGDPFTFGVDTTSIEFGNGLFDSGSSSTPWISEMHKLGYMLAWSAGVYVNIESCYVEVRPEHCKIKVSILIMGIVIICNISKVICIFITLRRYKGSPLVTLGDAVASFLKYPDHTTRGMCLVSKEGIRKNIWTQPLRPRLWQPTGKQEFWRANTIRWTLVRFLFVTSFSCCLATLISALYVVGVSNDLSAFETGIGFGTSLKKSPTILSNGINMKGTWSLFLNIILVNLPQSIISFMNVLYNSLFTAMLLVDEWNAFAHRRQPLRVTTPSGKQQSRYYLSLPYRYAVPIILLSGILHWLVSESLFLIRITAMRGDDIVEGASVSAMGYSALALFLAFLTCFVMLAFIYSKALRRVGSEIPMVGSCSAAISAACHVSNDEGDISTIPIQWGAVKGAGDTWKSCCTADSRKILCWG
ncbi:hypothetical protein ACMFMF_007935 [Clarireedia jacksonii]